MICYFPQRRSTKLSVWPLLASLSAVLRVFCLDETASTITPTVREQIPPFGPSLLTGNPTANTKRPSKMLRMLRGASKEMIAALFAKRIHPLILAARLLRPALL
jgi:hypothetical protein